MSKGNFVGFVLFCYALASGYILHARQDTLFLSSEKAQFSLYNCATILEDSANRLTTAQLVQPSIASQFQHRPLTNEHLNSTYWLRFTLRDSDPDNNRWLMELVDPHIGEFEFFEYKNGTFISLVNAGFDLPFSQKQYLHKNFIVEANFQGDEYKTYYVRIKSKSQNSFMIFVRKSNMSFGYALREYYILGIFYGVLLVMALYNLFLFFSIRESTYLYYVFYIISCAFISFSEDGLGFQYVWPDSPGFNRIVGYWNPLFFMIIFVVYAGSFLRLQERLPLWNKVIWGATALYVVVFLGQSLFRDHATIYMPIYLLPFALVYIAGIYSVFKGRKAARYFVLAYSFILVSIFVTFLRTNGWGDVGFIAVYSFNFGFFFEVLILSYAMSERFKEEKLRREAAQKEIIRQLQEREKYQEKLNRELETRVQERTAELAEANDEITRMNEILSEHNLALQNDVKQISLERISQQEISFEEFCKSYPDEQACYDYLASLKWQNGYTCKKCGNEKYNVISSHSRRCNKCKYIESVTAYTIFHSIKFSILHAFYMLFLINLRKDIKVEELATVVPLSEKSCGSFKRKVMAAEKSVRGKSKGGWERLIFYYEKED